MRRREVWDWVRFAHEEEREKKVRNYEINKIIVCKATITVYIYTVTVANE